MMSIHGLAGYLELTQSDLWPAPGEMPTQRVDDLLSMIVKVDAQPQGLDMLVVVQDAHNLLGRCTSRCAAFDEDQQTRAAIAGQLTRFWDAKYHTRAIFHPLIYPLFSLASMLTCAGAPIGLIERACSSDAIFRVACCQPSTLILSVPKSRCQRLVYA